jgi:hypothetical protein
MIWFSLRKEVLSGFVNLTVHCFTCFLYSLILFSGSWLVGEKGGDDTTIHPVPEEILYTERYDIGDLFS